MTTPDHMVLNIQLTQKQYTYLTKLHQTNSLRISFLFYWLLFFMVVMSRNDFELDMVMVLVGLVGGLIVSSIISLGVYYLTILQSKKHFISDKLLQYNQTYDISDSGISITSNSGTAHMNWNEIFKVTESKHIIALYSGKNRALILPKETIEKQMGNGIESLKNLIKKNVPDNKVKLMSK